MNYLTQLELMLNEFKAACFSHTMGGKGIDEVQALKLGILELAQQHEKQKDTREILKSAFITALYHYRPIGLKDLIPAVRQGKLLEIDSVAADCFAGVYHNILRLPPNDYEQSRAWFFKK